MKYGLLVIIACLTAIIVPLPVIAANRADINQDGAVNLLDVTAFIANRLANNINLDVIADGRVDIFDFNAILASLNYSHSTPTTTPQPTTDPSQKPTKKWHPGHYLQYNVDEPEYDHQEAVTDLAKPGNEKIKGIRFRIIWGDIEKSKDVYDFSLVRSRLNAIPEGKYAIIHLLERDYKVETCSNANLPKYIAKTSLEGNKGCIANYWDPVVTERLAKLYQVLGNEFDAHPKLFAIIGGETTAISIDGNKKLIAYNKIADAANQYFPTTLVFQNINHLSGGGGKCALLDQLASHAQSKGLGISNPDSVAWDSLPWNCEGNAEDVATFFGETDSGSKPKPMYQVFRKFKNTMPILTGGDTSQWGNPDNPKTFNSEKMDIKNLVKYHYLSSVTGYTHKTTDTFVEPYGANIMLWNSSFWSKDYAPSKALQDEWKTEMLNLINQPGNQTNQTCPSNINCQ